jgi:hypothetical protein
MQTTAIQPPSLTQNLPTTITQVLATPGASAAFVVSGVTFCNKTGGVVTVTFTCFNGSVDTNLAFQQSIGALDTLTFGGDFFKAAITNGFTLRALCSTPNSVDVAIFYTQFS